MYQNDLNPQKGSWFYRCKHWEWKRSHAIARITSTVSFGVIGRYALILNLIDKIVTLSYKTHSKVQKLAQNLEQGQNTSFFSISLTCNSWNFENQTFCEYNVSMYWMILWRDFSILESKSFWSIALIIR